jgi:hypothetical protein
MQQIRRKSEIRTHAAKQFEMLRKAADAQAAFRQPRPVTWHDVVLRSLAAGDTVAVAAQKAGMSRSALYNARRHEAGFDAAWKKACLAGYSVRRRALSLTMKKNSLSQKNRPQEHCVLRPSKLDKRVDPNTDIHDMIARARKLVKSGRSFDSIRPEELQ